MAPQQREVMDHEQHHEGGGGMRRVTSESDMSDAGGSSSREYHVRKSRLIGYVYNKQERMQVLFDVSACSHF